MTQVSRSKFNFFLFLSQAVQAGNMLFISGQLGMDPSTTTLVPGGVLPETEQALKNMGAILEAAGCTFKNGEFLGVNRKFLVSVLTQKSAQHKKFVNLSFVFICVSF